MNRDDVIKAINKACLNATAEKIADAIMELQKKPKRPEWEEKFGERFNSNITTPLSVFGHEIPLVDKWHLATPDKIKAFIRNEIIEKICEEISLDPNKWGSDLINRRLVNKRVEEVKARWLKGE